MKFEAIIAHVFLSNAIHFASKLFTVDFLNFLSGLNCGCLLSADYGSCSCVINVINSYAGDQEFETQFLRKLLSPNICSS